MVIVLCFLFVQVFLFKAKDTFCQVTARSGNVLCYVCSLVFCVICIEMLVDVIAVT